MGRAETGRHGISWSRERSPDIGPWRFGRRGFRPAIVLRCNALRRSTHRRPAVGGRFDGSEWRLPWDEGG
jgi:hypothetical protein